MISQQGFGQSMLGSELYSISMEVKLRPCELIFNFLDFFCKFMVN